MSLRQKGVDDAIANTVDLSRLGDQPYRDGVIEGLCRVRAFTASGIDHGALTTSGLKAAINAQKQAFRQKLPKDSKPRMVPLHRLERPEAGHVPYARPDLSDREGTTDREDYHPQH